MYYLIRCKINPYKIIKTKFKLVLIDSDLSKPIRFLKNIN